MLEVVARAVVASEEEGMVAEVVGEAEMVEERVEAVAALGSQLALQEA